MSKMTGLVLLASLSLAVAELVRFQSIETLEEEPSYAKSTSKSIGEVVEEEEVVQGRSKMDINEKLFNWIKKGDLERVKYLLAIGADPFATVNGKTTLGVAASVGQVEILLTLLQRGVDIDILDKKGGTAVMAAVQNEEFGAVVFLAVLGADLNIIDKKGKSALSLAEENQFQSIAKFLKKMGATDPSAPQPDYYL